MISGCVIGILGTSLESDYTTIGERSMHTNVAHKEKEGVAADNESFILLYLHGK